VHVTDTAAGSFRNFAAVGLYPIDIAKDSFVGNWFYGNVPRAVGAGLAVDFERNEFSGETLEIGIDVLSRAGFLAVYGNQIIAVLYLEAGLG
jgi:hypothetical protein